MTEQEGLRLATKEFSAVLAADPELRRLEGLKYDRKSEFAPLLDAIGLRSGWKIGALPVMPLTCAKWGFLWGIGNPLVAQDLPEGTVPTAADADIFLFVLSAPDLRKLEISFSGLPAAASGCTEATGLSPERVVREIHQVKQSAFHAFEMLPGSPGRGESVHYDADWLTLLSGVAARETLTPVEEVMHEMPLSTVLYHYVQYRRREDLRGGDIRRRPNSDVQKLISKRIDELSESFLGKG